MAQEFIIWGIPLPEGQHEVVLMQSKTLDEANAIIKLLGDNSGCFRWGFKAFKHLRIQVLDFETMPDFAGGLNL